MARHSALETARVAAVLAWPLLPAMVLCLGIPGLGYLILGSKRVALRAFKLIAAGIAAVFAIIFLTALTCNGDCSASVVRPLTTAYLMAAAATALWIPWATYRIRIPKMLATRSKASAAAEAPLASCPRCRAADRNSSGWCPACHSALQPGTVPTDLPLVASTDMHTGAGGARHRATPHRVGCSSGEMIRMWPGYSSLMAWPARRAYPDLTVTIEQAYRDPAESQLLWTQKHTLGTSRDGSHEDTRVVAWHRLRKDKIVSTWEFMPMYHPTAEPDATGPDKLD